MHKFSIRRAAAVFAILALAYVALIFRVAWLQTIGRQATLAKAERQQHQTVALQSRRGGIFDRNGFALALTIQKQDLFADPHFMQEVYQEEPHTTLEMDDAIQKLAQHS